MKSRWRQKCKTEIFIHLNIFCLNFSKKNVSDFNRSKMSLTSDHLFFKLIIKESFQIMLCLIVINQNINY